MLLLSAALSVGLTSCGSPNDVANATQAPSDAAAAPGYIEVDRNIAVVPQKALGLHIAGRRDGPSTKPNETAFDSIKLMADGWLFLSRSLPCPSFKQAIVVEGEACE